MKKVSSEFEKNAQSFVKSCLYFVDIFLFSNNFIQPVKDEGYYVLVKLCKGEFSMPVSQRTRLEKSIIAKFWWNKGKFICDENKLFYKGKMVILL